MTVREATYKAFNQMNAEFSVLELIRLVRIITTRPALTDGSILRRLRELRADPNEDLNYIVVDNKKATYQKLYAQKQVNSKPKVITVKTIKKPKHV